MGRLTTRGGGACGAGGWGSAEPAAERGVDLPLVSETLDPLVRSYQISEVRPGFYGPKKVKWS